jgi:hypothetical protein
MAKHTLNSDPDDFNFLLFGIACSHNQYVLATNINSALGIELQLEDYIDLSHKMGKDFRFSFFTFFDEQFNLEYNLIPNRSNYVAKEGGDKQDNDLFSMFNENVDESSRLIPELTKTDYLLLIKGDEHYNFTYKITDALKLIPEIISLQEIIPDKLSNKNNLIF